MSKWLIFAAVVMFMGWQQHSIQGLESEVALKQAKYDSLLEERDRVVLSLESSESANSLLVSDLENLDNVIAVRERELLESDNRFAVLSERQRLMEKDSEDYKIWSSQLFPDTALGLLIEARATGDSED